MSRPVIMKVGSEFFELRNQMKQNMCFPITDHELTDELARFLKERHIHETLTRRANLRHRRGLF